MLHNNHHITNLFYERFGTYHFKQAKQNLQIKRLRRRTRLALPILQAQ